MEWRRVQLHLSTLMGISAQYQHNCSMEISVSMCLCVVCGECGCCDLKKKKLWSFFPLNILCVYLSVVSHHGQQGYQKH